MEHDSCFFVMWVTRSFRRGGGGEEALSILMARFWFSSTDIHMEAGGKFWCGCCFVQAYLVFRGAAVTLTKVVIRSKS
jgi:hypothetical protein